MALNLQTLFDDFNGTAMVTGGTGEWSFIPQEYNIQIPVLPGDDAVGGIPDNYLINTTPYPDTPAQNAQPVVVNPHRDPFLIANYHALANAGFGAEEALLGALMRWEIASSGTLCHNIANRAVIEDEYTYVTGVHAGGNNQPLIVFGQPGAAIPTLASFRAIAKFAKRYTGALVSMMCYIFSARGHHWSPEYQEQYNKFKNASFIPANPGFSMPTNEQLFRLIIHGFGIRPLITLVLQLNAQGDLPAAMTIRFTPHAPIAGVAHVTTGTAVIREMQKERWYGAFALKFTNEITAMEAEVTLIGQTPYRYHVAAPVFGFPNRTMVSQNAEVAFKRLSQFLVGYVDYLGRRHSMSNQVAVTRKAGGAGPVADVFARACERFSNPDLNVGTMGEFLAQF